MFSLVGGIGWESTHQVFGIALIKCLEFSFVVLNVMDMEGA